MHMHDLSEHTIVVSQGIPRRNFVVNSVYKRDDIYCDSNHQFEMGHERISQIPLCPSHLSTWCSLRPSRFRWTGGDLEKAKNECTNPHIQAGSEKRMKVAERNGMTRGSSVNAFSFSLSQTTFCLYFVPVTSGLLLLRKSLRSTVDLQETDNNRCENGSEVTFMRFPLDSLL